jgi:hypothetical protein
VSRIIPLGLLVLIFVMAFACDSSSDGTTGADAAATAEDTGAEADAPIGPGDAPTGPLTAQPTASCVGMVDSKAIPQSLHDFCAAELTDQVLAGGDTCFSVEKPEDPKGPYCAFCALKGGTQKLCIVQVVP